MEDKIINTDIDDLIDILSVCNTLNPEEHYTNICDMLKDMEKMIKSKKIDNILIIKLRSFSSTYLRCIIFDHKTSDIYNGLKNIIFLFDNKRDEEGVLLCYKNFSDMKSYIDKND